MTIGDALRWGDLILKANLISKRQHVYMTPKQFKF
jgi:hypothetical protein